MNHDSLDVSKQALLPKSNELDLTFEDCRVEAHLPNHNVKTILQNTSGIARSGEIMAIMGPSGAGKTTLLNLLAGRISEDNKTLRLSGHVFVNGQKTSLKDIGNICSFVMQDDILLQTLTPRESFLFAANFKLKGSQAYKLQKVQETIEMLQLESCSNTLIGGTLFKGISGGEKKRTSIGVELIGDPSMIILDEPTSGLDSFTSFTILRLLRTLAHDYKKTIIFTIHQPNSDIFFMFDKLILLKRGDVVYQGKASGIVPYLESLSINLPEYCNPAEFYMDILTDQEKGSETWKNLNAENYMLRLHKEVTSEMNVCRTNPIQKEQIQNGFCYEIAQVSKRSFISLIRNPMLLKGRAILLIFMSFVYGSLYFQVTDRNINNQNDVMKYIQNVAGAIFFFIMSVFMPTMNTVLLSFPNEREVFIREQNSKLYRVSTYFIGKMSVEMIFAMSFPFVFTLIIYWLVGYRNTAEAFWTFAFVGIILSLTANALGLFFGTFFSDIKVAVSIAPTMILPFQMFSGLYVNLETVPVWFRWIQYLSPFKYSMEAMIRNEFLDNLIVVGRRKIDPVQTMSYDLGLWSSTGILIAMFLSFLVLAYLFLHILIRKLSFG